MAINTDAENWAYIELLYEAVQEGAMGLEQAPKLLKEVIQNDRWKSFLPGNGEPIKCERFVDFVTAKPIHGLGISLALMDRIASTDKELETLVAEAKTQTHGGKRNTSGTNQYTPKEVVNVNIVNVDQGVRPQGNTSQVACLRLSRQAPGLHARVLAGELSPHAAMIQAGFRKKTMTLPCDVESLAVRLAKIYDLSNLTELVTRLLLTIEDAKNKGECK